MKRTAFLTALLLFTALLPARAWVFPEHRDITFRAILKLDPARRALLDSLWAEVRRMHGERLSPLVADPAQGRNTATLDFATWPAIAGDHSVSAGDMLHNIFESDWILGVADVAAQLGDELAAAKNPSEQAGALRKSDLRFLRVDPEYVTRAGANNVHFMLAMTGVNTPAKQYFDSCFRNGTEINQIGTYIWYHSSALEKASRLSSPALTDAQRQALIIAAMADEAFAMHFLEDAFSAGHVAGIWGNAALRKGTHDYYDEHGLEVTTWKGERLILTGDAYMRPVDADRAAFTLLMSLEQFLDAAATPAVPTKQLLRPALLAADTFNVATAAVMPLHPDAPSTDSACAVLLTTPVPGMATGLGEIPRFRSEVGPFIGLQPAARVNIVNGGFGTGQVTAGMVPGLEIGLHAGFGLDGVLNESGDGLIFLDAGWRLDGPSTIKIEHDPDFKYFGSILSAIPSRNAFYLRLRLPFYAVPGDLIVLAPLLLAVAPNSVNKVVSTAAQGGVIPWQTGMISPLGRFQFVLGREVGICFYGSGNGTDAFFLSGSSTGNGDWALFSMHTLHFDFPVVEWRPVRTFSKRQSASLLMQLSAGLDLPGKANVIEPADATLNRKPIWSLGLRFAFDWRFYYAKKRTK